MRARRSRRQTGGIAISPQNGQWNTQTGHLERKTMLHKRYMIVRTIGQGGMGAVYQARDLKRQTTVAIKEMSLSMVAPEERAQAIQNFKAEAKMLWGLNHPYLPAFTGFFTEGSRYFMVMEYIDGSTLEDLLERNGGPFPERRVLGWARQLCDVLEYLHSQNPPIIFRDMKPGNIMLTRDGRIKLIDFGIARFFRSSGMQDTQLLGTPGFAPPEQYGKAQTDERSDIYSLAITLFQLLTNTLSETGFGLKDIRLINPNISPTVARALEKAAALDPDDRYNDIASFRRALLGVGTFIFDSGDQATTPEELAELCARYPDEAADYIASGEVESWLRELLELDLAREARQIRAAVSDPDEAVEQFLQAVLGPSARLLVVRKPDPVPRASHTGSVKAPTRPPTPASQPSRGPGLFARRPVSPLIITPRTLDFGEVSSGISDPLTLIVAGDQGTPVQGTIQATEPWILVDQVEFDGPATPVNVRVSAMHLRTATHYSGTILVALDGDEVRSEVAVAVEADIISTGALSNGHGAKTVRPDLDEEYEGEEDAITGGAIPIPLLGQVQLPITGATGLNGSRASNTTLESEYKAKYGDSVDTAAHGWEPLHASPTERLWLQRGLTFSAALMAASLSYTVVSQLPPALNTTALPPSPWFVLVLVCMIVAAPLGALLVSGTWKMSDVVTRACTGMAATLVALAAVRPIMQVVLHAAFAPVQLVVLLLVAALAATAGTHPMNSKWGVKHVEQLLKRARLYPTIFMSVLGGLLGGLLTLGNSFGWCTLLGIGAGVVVVVALFLYTDRRVRRSQLNTS